MTELRDIEAQMKTIRAQADLQKKEGRRSFSEGRRSFTRTNVNPNALIFEIPSESFHSLGGDENNRTSKSTTTMSSFLVSLDPTVISMIHNDEDADADDDDTPNDGGGHSGGRQSDLCCFCCCDLVKACVISNAIYAAMLSVFLAMSVLEVSSYLTLDLAFKVNASKEYYDDDIYTDVFLDKRGKISLLQTCAGITFALIGTIGAARFKRWAVLSTALGYILYCGSSILLGRFPGAMLAAFMAYPNVALYLALRSGNMTRDAYGNGTERHCCCRSDRKR